MTGKANVFVGRRGFTLFATMLVVLVLGDRMEMLRWPSAGRDFTTSGHPDGNGVTNQKSFTAIVYANAQQGRWRETSDSTADSGVDSASESGVRQPNRRRRSVSGRGRGQERPFYKKYSKELIGTAAALVGLIAIIGGYNYFWGSEPEGHGPDNRRLKGDKS